MLTTTFLTIGIAILIVWNICLVKRGKYQNKEIEQLELAALLQVFEQNMVVILDKDYNYLNFSKQFSERIKKESNQTLKKGMNVKDIFLDSLNRAKLQEELSQVKKGVVFSAVHECKNNICSYFYEVTYSPLLNNAQNHYGTIIFITDISQTIKNYEEINKLKDQLATSKKMEVLGLVAGGVAHDLNNVLSGLVSYPDLLLLDLEKDTPC